MGPNIPDDDTFLDDLEEEYLDEDFYKDYMSDEDDDDGWIEDHLGR